MEKKIKKCIDENSTKKECELEKSEIVKNLREYLNDDYKLKFVERKKHHFILNSKYLYRDK